MPTFEAWDVVKLPFPYTDRPVRQRRPALVVGAGDLLVQHGLLWVLMITSAENRAWPSDVPVGDHSAAALPVPSVVRTAKIAVVEARDAELLGTMPPGDRAAVAASLRRHLSATIVGERS